MRLNTIRINDEWRVLVNDEFVTMGVEFARIVSDIMDEID